jgi:hypothetical protein
MAPFSNSKPLIFPLKNYKISMFPLDHAMCDGLTDVHDTPFSLASFF